MSLQVSTHLTTRFSFLDQNRTEKQLMTYNASTAFYTTKPKTPHLPPKTPINSNLFLKRKFCQIAVIKSGQTLFLRKNWAKKGVHGGKQIPRNSIYEQSTISTASRTDLTFTKTTKQKTHLYGLLKTASRKNASILKKSPNFSHLKPPAQSQESSSCNKLC